MQVELDETTHPIKGELAGRSGVNCELWIDIKLSKRNLYDCVCKVQEEETDQGE